MRALRDIDSSLVQWVVDQTEREAEFRRGRTGRVDTFIFVERLLGQACGLLIGTGGMAAAVYIGMNGQPWLGGVIATVSLGTLAVASVVGRSQAKAPQKSSKPDAQ